MEIKKHKQIMKLIMLLLAPWLMWQGRQVRKNTLRLPEANGPRAGQSGTGEPLRLLILGDSAAAGVGCSQQHEALSGQLVAGLTERFQVDWQLWAKSSLTCAGILALAQQQASAAPFDVVVISAGVNDVTRRTPRPQWRNDLQALTNYLRHERGAKQIIFTAIPPMHKFPALPQPLRWFVGQQAIALNNDLQAHCQQAGCDYLTFDFPFQPEYMAKDGFHPSPKATTLWAEAVLSMVFER